MISAPGVHRRASCRNSFAPDLSLLRSTCRLLLALHRTMFYLLQRENSSVGITRGMGSFLPKLAGTGSIDRNSKEIQGNTFRGFTNKSAHICQDCCKQLNAHLNWGINKLGFKRSIMISPILRKNMTSGNKYKSAELLYFLSPLSIRKDKKITAPIHGSGVKSNIGYFFNSRIIVPNKSIKSGIKISFCRMLIIVVFKDNSCDIIYTTGPNCLIY